MLYEEAVPDINIIENLINQTLNRSIKNLKLILTTHMHPDHDGDLLTISMIEE